MKRKLSLLMMGLLLSAGIRAQQDARFTVEVSTDSILFGNYFKVTFTLENAQGGQFDPPQFEDFNVVSGPNVSSSFSMMNGTISQKVSYAFYLEPKEIGNFFIQPASIAIGEDVLETIPLEVMVVPNPEGIKQNPEPGQRDPFGLGDFKMDFFSEPWPDLNFFPSFPDRKPEQPPATPSPAPQPKKKKKTYKI